MPFTGGNDNHTTIIVTSVVLYLPYGLKHVHSLLGKEGALAVIGEVLKKDLF